MGARFSRSTGLRAAWLAMFVVVLGVRLLTPAGYMPGTAAGQVAIVLCDDEGNPPAQPHSAQHHGQAPHDHGGKGEAGKHHCPFASVAPLGGGSDAVASAAPLIVFADLPPAGLRQFLIERFRRDERPPSHAPPVLS